jgi:DNA-binding MarR family transcriptional regulator
MGRGLSLLEREVLAWLSENPPLDNGSRDFNWERHPTFRGEGGVASAPALSRALRRLEARGLIARSWSGPDHSGRVRAELARDAAGGSAPELAGGATP